MGHGVQQGHVGAGGQLQVVLRADMRRLHQIDAARIGHDQFRAFAQPALHAGGEDTGWPSVGLAPITKITSAWATDAKSCVPAEVPSVVFKPISGRRVTHAGAGIHVIVTERAADQLLHQDTSLHWCSVRK